MKQTSVNHSFDVTCLWTGISVSAFGNALYSAAIGIWVYQQTGSETWMGTIAGISFLISFLIEPIAGAVADALDGRNLLIMTDCIQGIAMLAIACLAYTATLSVQFVFAVSILAAGCNAIFSPASSVVLLRIIPQAHLAIAQARLRAIRSTVTLIATTISAILIVLWGVPVLIGINGISFLCSALSEAFITKASVQQAQQKASIFSFYQSLQDGVMYLFHQKELLSLIGVFFLLNLFSAGFDGILFAWYTEKDFPLVSYGLLLGAQSGASLMGAMVFSVVSVQVFWRKWMLFVLLGLEYSCYLLMLQSTNWFGCAILFCVFSFGSVALEMLLQLTLFEKIAPQHRGKVLGTLNAMLSLGTGLSMVCYGALAESFGVQRVCLLGGVLLLVPYIWFAHSQGKFPEKN